MQNCDACWLTIPKPFGRVKETCVTFVTESSVKIFLTDPEHTRSTLASSHSGVWRKRDALSILGWEFVIGVIRTLPGACAGPVLAIPSHVSTAGKLGLRILAEMPI